MRLNGTERTGTENRLPKFHGTLLTIYLLNLFLFAWLSMTKMRKLHVELCLVTWGKKHLILAALPIHRCTLSFCIIIMNGQERNGMEKQIDIYGKSLMFMSRDLLFHFVEGQGAKVEQFWILSGYGTVLNGTGTVQECFKNRKRDY